MNLGTLGIPSCVTSTKAPFVKWDFSRGYGAPAPEPRLDQSDWSVVSGRTTHVPAWLTLAGEGGRWQTQILPLVFNNTTSCVNLTLKMHACTYIYSEGRGYQDQPHTDTSTELYLNWGNYQSGRQPVSDCSSVDISFIIWLFSSLKKIEESIVPDRLYCA